jgi:hypothetical protein
MTEPTTLGIGLHICQSIDDDQKGSGCNKTYYEPNDLIFLNVALKGRPHTVKSRVLQLVVNNSIADSIQLDEYVDDFKHLWVLDENYTGNLRVDYVENGLRYWSRAFGRGTCVLPLDVNRITSDRLIFNLMKIRGQV